MSGDVEITTEAPVSQLETDSSPSEPQSRTERLAATRASLPNEHKEDPVSTVPAPVQPDSETLNQEKIQGMLKGMFEKEINNLRRSIGTGEILPKRLQGLADKYAELEKRLSQPQTVTPGVLASLSPEQQVAYKKLFQEILGVDPDEFNKSWQSLQQSQQEAMIEKNVSQMVDRSMSMLGENYEKVEPYAKQALRELVQAVNDGDEEAKRYFNELYTTRSGIIALMSHAQQRMSQELAKQNQGAMAGREKSVKAATTTLSSASRSGSIKPDELLQKPTPENRKEWLKKAKEKLGTVD